MVRGSMNGKKKHFELAFVEGLGVRVASAGTGNIVKVNGSRSPCQYQLLPNRNVQVLVTKFKVRPGWKSSIGTGQMFRNVHPSSQTLVS